MIGQNLRERSITNLSKDRGKHSGPFRAELEARDGALLTEIRNTYGKMKVKRRGDYGPDLVLLFHPAQMPEAVCKRG